MLSSMHTSSACLIFFFQAEDGIRDVAVTGVQTCALPISSPGTPVRGRDLARAGAVRRAGHRGGALHGGDLLRHLGARPVAGGARPAGSSFTRPLPLAAVDA